MELNERACELVYEALTGKCWHKFPVVGGQERAGNCEKCGHHHIMYYKPDLLHSLDAWIPLWELMGAEGIRYAEQLLILTAPSSRRGMGGYWELISGQLYLLTKAKPHHHLEAALRALEGECPECVVQTVNYGKMHSGKCTCNAGKVSLMTIWEREAS